MSDTRQLMWAILARAALTAPIPVRGLIDRVGAEQATDMLTTGDSALRGHGDLRDAARRDLDRAASVEVRLLTPDDADWPRPRLADLYAEHVESSAPVALWLRGHARLDTFAQSTIGMIGARAVSDYGRHVTADIAGELASRGWTICSGGAYGVDAAAHRAALAHSGTTIAVLATGVDRAYPSPHAGLFDDIAATGLLVSEYPPQTAPSKSQFLARNRLVAALTRGLVVTEAGLAGGTRNTVRWANRLARPVFAVPGPVYSASSAGCHAMIRDGEAELVTTTTQILDALTSSADHATES
ncbi:DNA-processing protein DprA [Nocardia sp. CA-120079]|uniref:DNA-processing protein DprA n=1 Tax=Nocardia sp. CA-120079 TaxID=3239974 RepID=UPI003D98A466